MMQQPPAQSPQQDTGLKCPKCGHNLTAITSNTCPECGERFVVTDLQGYVAKNQPSKLSQVCWIMWLVGTIMIIASWTGGVATWVGWTGFALAVVAWLMTMGARR